jgi:hypothetical protein
MANRSDVRVRVDPLNDQLWRAQSAVTSGGTRIIFYTNTVWQWENRRDSEP